MPSPDVVVIGAGIVGLAHALAAARRGLSVLVLERSPRAVGASIRNFGMVWPIGQPAGAHLRRAIRSREVWLEASAAAGFSCQPCGSLHAAYHEDELAVLHEFARQGTHEGCEVLTASGAREKSDALVERGLLGALWSPTEACVDPREAIWAIPTWLSRAFNVRFAFQTVATHVEPGLVRSSAGDQWRPKHIYVCSGSDFESLFPQAFADAPITRCKLQMLRTAPIPAGWRIGPHLAAGLTLIHYKGFQTCPSLAALRARFQRELPEYLRLGIHVLVSQNSAGELTLGDSHEYGRDLLPFDQESTDRLILDYLARFFAPPTLKLSERWHGIYAKMTDGRSAFVHAAAPGVWAVTGLGGAGMTLSFGLAEEVVAHALDGAPFPMLTP